MNKSFGMITSIVLVAVLLLILLGSRMFVVIPAGHVGVATLFGQVQSKSYPEGLHFPTNPFYKWKKFDARQNGEEI